LTSATVLLVGVGESGVETARLCKTALGMRVLGVDARRTGVSPEGWWEGELHPPSATGLARGFHGLRAKGPNL
jgi:lactate dehydrogenase-like 2-hydroxyacid dehydrogenase